MQIPAWFGIFTVDNDTIITAEIFQKDLPSIIQRLLKERLMLRGSIAGRIFVTWQ